MLFTESGSSKSNSSAGRDLQHPIGFVMSVLETVESLARFVYTSLGSGYTENVYQQALCIELQSEGWTVNSERCVEITYVDRSNQRHSVGLGRVDILANHHLTGTTLILELKLGDTVRPAHIQQLLGYQRQLHNVAGLIYFPTGTSSVVPTIVWFGKMEKPQSELDFKAFDNPLHKARNVANEDNHELKNPQKKPKKAGANGR